MEHEQDEGGSIVVPIHDTAREESPVAIPIGQMSILDDLVHQLDEMIRDARNMPLSSSALIDRKEVLALIEMLQRSIPEEIARARAIIRDRDEVIERAQSQAERIVERARQDREALLSKTEIVQAATRQADQMLGEAEAVAKRIKAEADNYVEGKLATFEVVLQRTMAAVERGRSRLAGRIDQDQLADEPIVDGDERGF